MGSLSERGRPSDHIPVAVAMHPRSKRIASRSPNPPCVFEAPLFWQQFQESTTAHGTILDLGGRLDALVEELQRAAAVVRAVLQVALQGGLGAFSVQSLLTAPGATTS